MGRGGGYAIVFSDGVVVTFRIIEPFRIIPRAVVVPAATIAGYEGQTFELVIGVAFELAYALVVD